MQILRLTSILLVCFISIGQLQSSPTAVSDEAVTVTTSMHVDTVGTIYIEGSFYGDDAEIENDGSITVNSSEGVDVELPAVMTGEGLLSFTGTDDFDVTSSGDCEVPNLLVNTTGDVFMDVNVTVNNELELLDGIVEVQNPSVLSVASDDPDAIVFDDDEFCSSYVVGFLGRNVLSGQSYYYPVGGEAFHPMMIHNIENDTEFKVLFDATIPTLWQANTSVHNVLLLDDVGWEVGSETSGSGDFAVGLSKYTSETVTAEEYKSVFYAEDRNFSTYDLDGNSYLSQNYLMSSTDYRVGIYGISIERDLDLPNFFYVDGSNMTTFKIPDIDNYTHISFHVVDRLGKEVFESDNYYNEFDVSGLSSGTYFYQLTLKEENYERTIYNFIEVRHESK